MHQIGKIVHIWYRCHPRHTLSHATWPHDSGLWAPLKGEKKIIFMMLIACSLLLTRALKSFFFSRLRREQCTITLPTTNGISHDHQSIFITFSARLYSITNKKKFYFPFFPCLFLDSSALVSFLSLFPSLSLSFFPVVIFYLATIHRISI